MLLPQSIHLKTGKVHCLTAYGDTTLTHLGATLLDLSAGQQAYFACPSASSFTVEGDCHVTQCSSSALAITLSHIQDNTLHLTSAQQTALGDLISGVYATTASLRDHYIYFEAMIAEVRDSVNNSKLEELETRIEYLEQTLL